MKLFLKEIIYVLTAILLVELFIISCKKEVSVSPPDEPPPGGNIYFDTYPEGFNIYLNNKYRVRQTPDSLPWLEEGEYIISLKKQYFRDSVFTIILKKNEQRKLMIDFSENPKMLGSIKINSFPQGASVWINDSAVSLSSPCIIDKLLPGEYKIKLTLPDHKAENFIQYVHSNKETEIIKGLVDTTIWEVFDEEVFPLLDNNLTDIEIDDIDNVWIGSREGLIIFDGIWQVLNQDNSKIPHKVISDIELDYEGNLWVATQFGFAIIRGKEISKIYLTEGKSGNFQNTFYPSDNINTFYVNDRLPFYFGFDIGLGMAQAKYPGDIYKFYHFDSEIFRIYPYFFLNNYKITSINRLLQNNKILIGTKGNGVVATTEEQFPEGTEDFLNLRNKEIFENYTKGTHALPSNTVVKIVNDAFGSAWILFAPDGTATRSGLAYYNSGNFTIHHFSTIDPKVNKYLTIQEMSFGLELKTGLCSFMTLITDIT